MKAFRITIGALSGAVFTHLQFALNILLLFYVPPVPNGLQRPFLDWAIMFAFYTGVVGFVLGLPFGLFLAIANLGRIFGTVSGAIAGGLFLLFWIPLSEIQMPHASGVLLVVCFIVTSGLTGFLTSHTFSRLSRWWEEY